MRLPHFRLSLLRAMIIVPILGIFTPFLVVLFVLGYAVLFGDVPWGRWSVPNAAAEHMALVDPKFRIEDYEATTRWVGGRNGSWEVYYTHKVSGQRRCLRYISTFIYGAFIEIDCPPAMVRPSS